MFCLFASCPFLFPNTQVLRDQEPRLCPSETQLLILALKSIVIPVYKYSSPKFSEHYGELLEVNIAFPFIWRCHWEDIHSAFFEWHIVKTWHWDLKFAFVRFYFWWVSPDLSWIPLRNEDCVRKTYRTKESFYCSFWDTVLGTSIYKHHHCFLHARWILDKLFYCCGVKNNGLLIRLDTQSLCICYCAWQ